MANVNRSSPARRGQLWGYWVPEPALLLGPKTMERSTRYLMNWLRLRPAWIYLLGRPDSGVTRVLPQWWRDVLNGDMEDDSPKSNSARAKRLDKVKEVFGRALDMDDFTPSSKYGVRWFARTINSLTTPIARQVIWEILEMGFRHELQALDRILVPGHGDVHTEASRREYLSHVFPNGDIEYVRELPTTDVGLTAARLDARLPYLEAFRRVLIRWPLCPHSVHSQKITLDMPMDQIVGIEANMLLFYVETFFSYSGRAPLIPHAFPV